MKKNTTHRILLLAGIVALSLTSSFAKGWKKDVACTTPGTPSVINGSACGGGNVTLEADPVPPGGGGGALVAKKAAVVTPQAGGGGGGNATYTTNWYYTATSPTPFTSGAIIVVNVAITTTYYAATHSSDGCESARVPVTATIVNLTTAAAGSNNTLCGLTTTTLAANTAVYGTGAWTVSSGPSTASSQFSNTSIPNANFTPAGGAGNYVLTWRITNGSCSSSSNVTITYYVTPTAANAGPDQTGSSTCGFTTVSLAGNPPTVGTGLWSFANDNTTTGGSITTPSSTTSSFSGTAGGTYNLFWTITNGPCTSVDEVVITFNRNPTAAAAGSPQTICASGSAVLAANSPSVGTGAWSVSGPNTSLSQFNNSSSPTATFTPAGGAGVYTLTWTISNAPCGSSSSSVAITVNALPTVANAGPDQTGSTTCGSTSVSLAANPASVGSGNWSIVSGTGGSIATPSNAASTFSGTAGATYTLRWSISNGVCATSTDDVIITFNTNPTVANAGPDQTGSSTCGLTTVTLAGNLADTGSGSWSVVSGTGGSFGNPSASLSTFTGTAGTTYTLRWSISLSPCATSTDDVIIAFNKIPTVANAGPDQTGASTCGLTSVTLAGNTPTIGSGTWSIISGSSGSFGNASSATSTFAGTTGTTYTIRWTISNGPCTASTDDAIITFNRNPTTSVVGPDQTGASSCGLTTVTLAANTPTVGTGSWSIAPDSQTTTGGSFSNVNSPTSTFTGTAGKAYGLVWTIANSPCTASLTEMQVSFNLIPTVAATANPIICSGSTATITLSNPNNISGTTYSWTSIAYNAKIPTATSGNSITGVYTNSDAVNQGVATYNITPTAGACKGTPITATVTVKNTPVPPSPATFLGYGTAPLTIPVVVPSGAQANWYADLVTTTKLSTASSYQTTYDAALVFYVSLTDLTTTCESSRSQLNATFVTANITPAQVMEEGVRVANQTTDAGINALTGTQIAKTISFMDGLSRTSQVIALKASPSGNDLVQPVEYNSNGQTAKNYLPYVATTTGNFQTNYAQNQASFYTAANDKIADDNFPYSVATFEQSPLARPLIVGNVGASWQPGVHPKSITYSYNTGAAANDDNVEEVRKFASDGSSTGFYPANTLTKTVVTDENGNTDVTFKNAFGNTVVRKQYLNNLINGTTVNYLQTYYVYDDLNRVKYIITPGGQAALKANGWVLSQTIIDQHLHQFVYDARGRLSQKKIPTQAWTYYAYDKLNRLVLTQDGNLRPLNKWAFVKYDLKGRTVMAGLYTNTTQTTLATVQSWLDTQFSGSSVYYEKQGLALQGYTNNSFPTRNDDAGNSPLEVLSVNYYDNYDFDNNGTPDYTYDNTHLAGLPATTSVYVRGLPTGSKKLILGTTNWLVTAVFYDNYGRPIQTQSNNHLNLTGVDKSSVTYDFEGKVVQAKNYHNAGGTNQVTTLQTPVYDATTGQMLKTVKHSINGAADQIVSQYQYNELGQVVTKQLHSTDGTTFLQNVDYRYNIRGWLTSINNAQLTNDGGATNSDTNDYFGMELLYNTTDASGLANTPYYNGNVSALKWKGAGSGNTATGQRSYKFAYDNTDKLTAATFQKYGSSAWDQEQNTLNESMSYDHNGNILSLQRNQNVRSLSGATVVNTATAMDNLTYTYASANQLSKVTDATAQAAGFNDGSNTTTEYTYDTHGNLKADLNKGISNITYNALGKAQQIAFSDGRVINYTYDAGGTKLTMAATVSGTTTTTNYVNGFVYNTANSVNTLTFMSSPEGRVVKNGSNFEYQYAIADHQGNTRVVFSSVTPTPAVLTATFEGDANDNSGSFTDVNHVVAMAAANHSTVPAGANKVEAMNQSYPVGPSKSIKVFAGDKVDAEVYAYYEVSTGWGVSDQPLTALITSISGAFGGVSGGTGDAGNIYNGVSSSLNNFGHGPNQGDAAPSAYLNYIYFDKNYKVKESKWIPVTTASWFSKQKIALPTINADEAGYVFIYLSFEDLSNNYVYFDDLKITYTPTNIVQSNEYYPFGLQAANSWTRDNTTVNNFLYDAGNELNTTSGFYDLPFRNYDAALGRFFQVDPLSIYSHDLTPYHYANNNPIGYNDPFGLMAMVPLKDLSAGQQRSLYHSSGSSLSFEDWAQSYDAENGYGPDFGGPSGGSAGYGVRDGKYFDSEGKSYYVFSGTVYIPSAEFWNDPEWEFVPAQDVVDYGGNDQNRNYVKRAQRALDDHKDGYGPYRWDWGYRADQVSIMFLRWVSGFSPDKTFNNDRVARALMDAPGVVEAREKFYMIGKISGEATFGLNGLEAAGLDPVEQFIGKYHYKIDVVGDNLQFTITNTTSFGSFLYNKWPYSWNWNSGPMSNYNQTYIFREPLRK